MNNLRKIIAKDIKYIFRYLSVCNLKSDYFCDFFIRVFTNKDTLTGKVEEH